MSDTSMLIILIIILILEGEVQEIVAILLFVFFVPYLRRRTLDDIIISAVPCTAVNTISRVESQPRQLHTASPPSSSCSLTRCQAQEEEA